jgi:hypothetical protein
VISYCGSNFVQSLWASHFGKLQNLIRVMPFFSGIFTVLSNFFKWDFTRKNPRNHRAVMRKKRKKKKKNKILRLLGFSLFLHFLFFFYCAAMVITGFDEFGLETFFLT